MRPRAIRFPLTVLAATMAFATAAPSAHAADCAGQDVEPSSTTMTVVKEATLCLLNAERAAAGLPALRAQSLLDATAQAYSATMVADHFFAHVTPGGETLTERLDAYVSKAGGWTIGENLAWGEAQLSTPRGVMNGWMNSPGHRANILNRDFTEVGIGVVQGTPNGSSMTAATWTTHFGARDEADAAAASTTAPAPTASTKPATTTKRAAKSRCSRSALKRLSKKTRRARAASCARAAKRAAAARRAAAAKRA